MLAIAEAYGLSFQVPAGDVAVGASLVAHGEFARPEVDFLIATAGEEIGAFVDVGANLGAIALPFAAQRPRWSVLAIEPHPGLFNLLQGSAARNQLDNVASLRAAVGSRSEMVAYPSPSLSHRGNYGDLGFHVPAESIRAPTPMVRLDDVSTSPIKLVKVDVQGFEPEVLWGASRLLEQDRPVWFVEASADPSISAEVVRKLQSAGYDLFWFYSPFVTASPLRGGPPATPLLGDANFVAVPRGGEPVWPLPKVAAPDARRPGHSSAYPYLARYGY